MLKFWKYMFTAIVALPLATQAQQKAVLHFDWRVQGTAKPEHRNMISSSSTFQLRTVQSNTYPEIKYSLPKAAVFCRMEDALHKRFNIWVKVRMGTDDRYSN